LQQRSSGRVLSDGEIEGPVQYAGNCSLDPVSQLLTLDT